MILAILAECWEILAESAPYILVGFFAAGLLKAFIPEEAVARHLGRNSLGAVLKASLFGVPLPLCSCGVIPAAVGLRKQGASKGASAAFLVSVPETGVAAIALCSLALGWLTNRFYQWSGLDITRWVTDIGETADSPLMIAAAIALLALLARAHWSRAST